MNILALRPLSVPLSGRASQLGQANQVDSNSSSADLGDFISFTSKAGVLAHELQGLDGPFPALAAGLNLFGNVGPQICAALQSGDMAKVSSLCLDAGKQIADIVANLPSALKEAAKAKVGPLMGAITSGRDFVGDLDRYVEAPSGSEEARWTGIQATVDGMLTIGNVLSATPAGATLGKVLVPVLLVAAMCSIVIGQKAKKLRQNRLGKTPCVNPPTSTPAQGPRSSPQARLMQQLTGVESRPPLFDQVG